MRGQEPEQLRIKRDEELPRARKAGRVDKELRGYGVAKGKLFEVQNHNCAYCEAKQVQAEYRDVDHFRPKSSYWWLAWSWDNLLFSCEVCNRSHKKDQFPLLDEAMRLQAEELPPGREQPLLLDPFDTTIDLRQEIKFRSETIERKQRWRPVGLTERGRKTIELCGLDRPALLDAYTDHVNERVRPRIEDVRQAAHDRRRLEEEWYRLCRSLNGQQFRALSSDAVHQLLGPQLRAHGLHWYERDAAG
ncbi:MAG TPA: HNH endonuclease [Kofleriaceae bacterium]|nr:HNH endonuclease [Kofleriaceae bacterium]